MPLAAILVLSTALIMLVGFLAFAFVEMRRKHPRGLMVLFFVEMWERFSYYGMRALLLLYMVAPPDKGGLGWSLDRSALIYSTYTMCAYAFGLPGGWMADKFLGYRRAVFLGGAIMATGHLALAFHGNTIFFSGLVLIIIGTGLLKTNCTTLVGQLYEENDARRDGGFSLYYIGINVGAFAAPLICGYFAQDKGFMERLAKWGLATTSGWHWGFGAAGVAMIFGLIQYVLQQDKLGKAGLKTGEEAEAEERHAAKKAPLTREEWQRIAVVGILFVFATLFWATYEQAGSTLNIFADQHVNCSISGWAFPSTWYQSVNSFFIFVLASIIGWLWIALGRREPSSPMKFVYGLFLVGAGMAVLIPISMVIDRQPGTLAGPLWLVGVYFLHTVGELCLSPVGLSLTTKLAPTKIAGMIMGLWFWSMALGNALAGQAARLFGHMSLTHSFELVFAVMTAASLVLLALTPSIKKLMGGVH